MLIRALRSFIELRAISCFQWQFGRRCASRWTFFYLEELVLVSTRHVNHFGRVSVTCLSAVRAQLPMRFAVDMSKTTSVAADNISVGWVIQTFAWNSRDAYHCFDETIAVHFVERVAWMNDEVIATFEHVKHQTTTSICYRLSNTASLV